MRKMLLRPNEAAEALGIGRTRCYEMIATGELPSVKIGRSVRVPVSALEKWVEDRTLAHADGYPYSVLAEPTEKNSHRASTPRARLRIGKVGGST